MVDDLIVGNAVPEAEQGMQMADTYLAFFTKRSSWFGD